MSWEKKTLGDVVNLQRGYDLTHAERTDGPFPVISSSGITDYHSEYKEIGPGVITGRYGTLGQVYYVEGNYWPHNTTLFVEDFKGNDPRFVYYLLQTLGLDNNNDAGAVPGVNRQSLHSIKVEVPDLPLQQQIAAVLGRYDVLLKNYQQQVAALEDLTQEVYREWFVRGRGLGVTVDASVELPAGWTTVELGSMSSLIQRGITPSYDDEEGAILCLNQRCIRDNRIDYSTGRLQTKNPGKKVIQFGDVLINSTGEGTLGRTAQVYKMPEEAVTIDTHVTIARPAADIPAEYYGFLVTNLEDYFVSMALGATGQTELSREAIGQAKVIKPTPEAMQEFSRIVAPMKRKIINLLSQMDALRATRDALLPRLLSGQLAIDEPALAEA